MQYKHAYLLPLLSLLVLFFGFLREVIIAQNFGVSREIDAYAAVLAIYVFFGVQISNTVESAFIANYSHREDDALVSLLCSNLFGLFFVLTTILTVLYFFAAKIVTSLFPFDTIHSELAAQVIRWFIPAMFLAALVGMFRAVLNIKGRYVPGLLYGAMVSVPVGVLVQLYSRQLGVLVMPVGYFFGNVLALLVLVICVRTSFSRLGYGELLARISKPFALLGLASWILASEIIFQCSYISERSIASGLQEGAVSAYFYAMSLLMVFTAVVIQPATTILFPIMARKYQQDPHQAHEFVMKLCGLFFGLGLFGAVALKLVAPVLIELIFVRGKFTVEDANTTASILGILAFVLPFMSVNRLLKNAHLSRGSIRLPFFANLGRWVLLLGAAALLVERFAIEGLAVAYVISSAFVPMLFFFRFAFDKKAAANVT